MTDEKVLTIEEEIAIDEVLRGDDGVVDYHRFTTIDTSQADRRKLHIGDIFVNSATCNRCGNTVRSRNKHDYRSCTCGSLSVDGGSWYARRCYTSDRDYEGFEDKVIYFRNIVINPKAAFSNSMETKE